MAPNASTNAVVNPRTLIDVIMDSALVYLVGNLTTVLWMSMNVAKDTVMPILYVSTLLEVLSVSVLLDM